jgi:thiol-disulfide isomerase/thioredoxin
MLIRIHGAWRLITALTLSALLSACGADLGVDQNGAKVAQSRLEGQWLVVNYWAQWCAPCRSEIPQLNQLSQQLAEQGVQVLGVNFDGLQGDKLKQATEEMAIQFTVLAQNPAERYQLPRSEALPVTYIVDDHGKVRERLLGEQTAAGLTARLQALKAEG